MIKDFDKWNRRKKAIEDSDCEVLFRTKEIWWCYVGLNIKIESCGKGDDYKRPVLVLRKLSAKGFIGIPLSTQAKKGSWFVDLEVNGKKGCALIYQIKMFSSSRMYWRISVLDDSSFESVKEKLRLLLELF
ncbi:MAG: type II toxin-antitoxin system PemK/MazF family toxin [bacterium]